MCVGKAGFSPKLAVHHRTGLPKCRKAPRPRVAGGRSAMSDVQGLTGEDDGQPVQKSAHPSSPPRSAIGSGEGGRRNPNGPSQAEPISATTPALSSPTVLPCLMQNFPSAVSPASRFPRSFSRRTQNEEPGILRKASSSGVERRPRTELRCGYRPNRSMMALCRSSTARLSPRPGWLNSTTARE
jgi:hypothetical protein